VSEIDMYSRLIRSRLLEAQQDTPVTLLAGPRQAGKTTLVKQISVEQE
jgi:predicted AAA+ superfamily ATPase